MAVLPIPGSPTIMSSCGEAVSRHEMYSGRSNIHWHVPSIRPLRDLFRALNKSFCGSVTKSASRISCTHSEASCDPMFSTSSRLFAGSRRSMPGRIHLHSVDVLKADPLAFVRAQKQARRRDEQSVNLQKRGATMVICAMCGAAASDDIPIVHDRYGLNNDGGSGKNSLQAAPTSTSEGSISRKSKHGPLESRGLSTEVRWRETGPRFQFFLMFVTRSYTHYAVHSDGRRLSEVCCIVSRFALPVLCEHMPPSLELYVVP